MRKKPFHKFLSSVLVTDGCWEWVGRRGPEGYGVASRMFGRAHITASRAAWFFKHGQLPVDVCVLHRCDNRACVRPSHLFTGSQADNMADKKAKGRQLKGQDNPRAKLKDSDVLEIARRLDSGEKVSAIAAVYPVTPSVVSSIKKRRSWKHLLKEPPQ